MSTATPTGHVCPACGFQHNTMGLDVNDAVRLGERINEAPRAVPVPGDFTVCRRCVRVLLFTGPTTVRLATLEDACRLPPRSFDLLVKTAQAVSRALADEERRRRAN